MKGYCHEGLLMKGYCHEGLLSGRVTVRKGYCHEGLLMKGYCHEEHLVIILTPLRKTPQSQKHTYGFISTSYAMIKYLTVYIVSDYTDLCMYIPGMGQ